MAQNIVDLAAQITRGADALSSLYKENNLEGPSHFNEPVPLESSKSFTEAKNEILDAAIELYDLLLNPSQLLRLYSGTANTIVLHFIYRFNIAQIVPVNGTISFEEIAQKCGQPKRDVVRLLRHAMSICLFDEPEDGQVRHTRQSALLRTEAFYNRIGGTVEDNWTAATKMIDAMAQYPGSESANESGYALAQPDRISFYDHMSANQEHSDRFTKGRKSYGADHKPEIAQLASVCHGIDSLKADGTTMVDIGGASGWVSMELSKEFPSTKFIVEDLASVIATRENGKLTNGDIKPVDPTKIEFKAYDIFTEQPVHGAEVYYMRWILHNHGDAPAVRILQNLVPAMQKGSRLLIHDYVLDGFEEMKTKSKVDKRMTSSMDIGMQMLFNARERTAEDWDELLARADSRFKVANINRAEGSSLALIDVVWT